MKPTFLNSREARKIAKKINEQWDADFKFEDFVIKSIKDKIYVVSRDLEMIDFKKYNIENYGMYFGHINPKNGEIRLSVEGAEVIGPLAKKNVIEIDQGLMKLWMAGQDIPHKGEVSMVIIKFGNDYLGSGKLKEGQILNFVPKTRRYVKD